MRGGKREGSGRKTKDTENRIRTLCITALNDVFGSEENAFKHIAAQSKKLEGRDSLPFIKMLIEYAYGKPKEYEAEQTNANAFEVWQALTKEEKLLIIGDE